uniref:Uncharacterized protein n=1 Tax=Arundo donax TaxID=35708 RepID=A0A0A9AM64_ARUDO
MSEATAPKKKLNPKHDKRTPPSIGRCKHIFALQDLITWMLNLSFHMLACRYHRLQLDK